MSLGSRRPAALLAILGLSVACSAPASSAGGAGGEATSASSSSSGAGASTSTSSSSGATSSSSGATSSSSGATSSSSGASSSSSSSGGGDPLDATFVFVGCNRLQKADWDPAVDASSANVAELHQTFVDVTNLPEKPAHFFFAGDLVLGLDATAGALSGELGAWAQLLSSDPSGIAATIPVVPLVGNHEMLVKTKANGSKVELSNPPADAVWSSWVTANGFAANAGNGPTAAPPNPDALGDDQSKLTYSFTAAGTHYVLLNTDSWTTTPDPATGDTQIGWIALTWLSADLAAAQADAAVKHVVVLGHKPIVSPTGGTTSADVVNPALTGALESLLDQTAKVRGYFCAHAHLWDARKLPGNRGVYQVVAGNGGSAVESSWAQPFYGFTEVRLHESGKASVVSWQRPVPAIYFQSPAAPAVAQAELVIAP